MLFFFWITWILFWWLWVLLLLVEMFNLCLAVIKTGWLILLLVVIKQWNSTFPAKEAAVLWHWVYFSPDRSLYVFELVNHSFKQCNQVSYKSSLYNMFMYPTFFRMYNVILIPAVNTSLSGLYLHNKCEYFLIETSVSLSYPSSFLMHCRLCIWWDFAVFLYKTWEGEHSALM